MGRMAGADTLFETVSGCAQEQHSRLGGHLAKASHRGILMCEVPDRKDFDDFLTSDENSCPRVNILVIVRTWKWRRKGRLTPPGFKWLELFNNREI